MSIYSELQGIAKDVLSEFNQGGLKLVHITEGAGGTPDEPLTAERVYDLEGVAIGGDFKYEKDGFIAIAEKQVTVAIRNDVEPSINDFIEIDGIRYKIVKNLSVPGAGTKCVWKFLVSKGV